MSTWWAIPSRSPSPPTRGAEIAPGRARGRAELSSRRPGAALADRARGAGDAGRRAVDDRPAARLHQALCLCLAQMGRAGRAGADGRAPAVALAPSAAAAARRGGALAGDAGADRPLGVAGAVARHADQRLADELGRRRQRLLVRLHPPARPGAARPRLVRGLADDASYPVAAPDRGADAPCRCRRAPRPAAARRRLPSHVAVRRNLMRAWPILALLLLASPASAGPQDAWTIDPRASSLTFTASQVGAFVNGRFPTWAGEIVFDPAALAAARIDIKIETPPVTTNNHDVDSLLKGPNFLDVQKFPAARFVSTSIAAKGGERYEAQGKLTIRDVTRDAVLPFTLAIADDPAQSEAARLRRRPERMGRHRP